MWNHYHAYWENQMPTATSSVEIYLAFKEKELMSDWTLFYVEETRAFLVLFLCKEILGLNWVWLNLHSLRLWLCISDNGQFWTVEVVSPSLILPLAISEGNFRNSSPVCCVLTIGLGWCSIWTIKQDLTGRFPASCPSHPCKECKPCWLAPCGLADYTNV